MKTIKRAFLLFTLNDTQDVLTVMTMLRSPTHLLFKTFCLQRAANQKEVGFFFFFLKKDVFGGGRGKVQQVPV